MGTDNKPKSGNRFQLDIAIKKIDETGITDRPVRKNGGGTAEKTVPIFGIVPPVGIRGERLKGRFGVAVRTNRVKMEETKGFIFVGPY